MSAHPAETSHSGALVWLRRDLRADDHAALHLALRSARRVWCAFVFDRAILDPLPRADRRVEFLRDSLAVLDAELRALALSHGVDGADRVGLLCRHGSADDAITDLATQLGVQAVYACHDDEPYALQRDAQARGRLAQAGIALHTVKDHVVFERAEVMTGILQHQGRDQRKRQHQQEEQPQGRRLGSGDLVPRRLGRQRRCAAPGACAD